MKKKILTLPVKFQYHLIFEFSLSVISFCVFWNEQSMVMHANRSLFIIFLSPLIFDT